MRSLATLCLHVTQLAMPGILIVQGFSKTFNVLFNQLTNLLIYRALQPSLLTWMYGDEEPKDIILPWLENFLQGLYK